MAFENRKKEKELKKLIKTEDLKGIVRFIKENADNEEIDFEIIYDEFGVSDKNLIHIINDDGKFIYKEAMNNIYHIVFTNQLKELMIKHDPNWEDNFSKTKIDYIKYSLENPEIDEVFKRFEIMKIDDKINEYFDGHDIKDNIFDDMPFDYEVLRDVISNPNFRKRFTNLEIEFIKKCHKLDENIEDLFLLLGTYIKKDENWRKNLPDYFDGKKMLPKYYKELMLALTFNDDFEEQAKDYYKYFSKNEIAFIKNLNGNKDLKQLCQKYGIDLDNFQKYFMIENNDLKLTNETVQIALQDKEFLFFLVISDEDYHRYDLTENEMLVIETLKKQESIKVKNGFLEILKQKDEILTYNNVQMESFVNLLTLLVDSLENTNSKEMHKFKGDILIQLMNSKNPKIALELINEVYTKNNLPDVGKSYLIFKILHPNYTKFNLTDDSMISPTLKNCKNDNERDIIIFSDLLKTACGSNNRSIRDYLLNIKEGNELFLNIDAHNINKLNNNEINTLKVFLNHLRALYNNTKIGKEKPIVATNNLIADIEELKKAFTPTERYDLPDRIVRSFGYFAGFKSYNDAWEYFVNKVEIADKRNRLHSEKILIDDFKLEQGDFIKGIGNLEYFKTILQNGSVAREFLGIGACSDFTPLDTDLTRIENENETLESMINNSNSTNFGPIYLILKNNDNICITRDEFGNEFPYDTNKLEAFSTGTGGHYGIRTGFATTEVDYIVIDNKHIENILPEVKHTIVTNGFYIPVLDSKTGKVIFSTQEYDEMKKKMSGVKYYTNDDFVFSNNLNVDSRINEIKENLDKNMEDATIKKKKINEVLAKKLNEVGIEFKDYFDSDISLGNVQLIDTGSTGRGTQTGITSDFDFIMRIDSNMNSERIKDLIFQAFNVSQKQDIMKNIRLKGVKIDEELDPIDLDISFVKKAETNFYSTDSALKDRLDQIKKQDIEKYKDVISNIILAKQILKDAGVYKPNHARENAEGGLGGVGVENWVLQHGGSFYDAALSFVEAAKGKSFTKFANEYKVWDYGLNFYTGKFDEFVSQNMSEDGYRKMIASLEQYLKTVKVIEKDVVNYDYSLDSSMDLLPEEESLKL